MKRFQYIAVFFLAVMISSGASAQSYKLPQYEKFTLSNGLTVYLMEQHEVPTINVSAIVPAGAIYDDQKAGLASLTAAGLQYGTKSFTKTKMEEELDFIGASLNTYATKESAGLSAEFASKDQDKVLGMIKEVLVDPVFNAEEFEKEKKRVITGLDQAKESPRQVINSYWDKLLYGEHVYGNAVTGTPVTVGKLVVADLKEFYKKNYRPEASAISVVGDFNSKEMRSKLSKLFASWKKSGASQPNLASKPVSPAQGAKVLLVNKEDARETTFLIGGLGISRNNPDYVAIDVINTVFGGRFTSMLNDELRVNSGLTYGANSRF